MSHVFVSYSKKNKDYVLQLVDKLLDEGFDVWIDNRRLRSSEDWWRSIVEALRDADAFVVVLTPDSDASEWVQLEITLAMKYKKPRFPILLAGTMDTPNWDIFARTQYVDATNGQLPQPEFYELIGQHAKRKSFRGTTLGDTGKLDRKVGPFLEDDPILIEAISSPPLTIDEGEDLDLTQLATKPSRNVAASAVITSTPKPRISLRSWQILMGIGALFIVIFGIAAFMTASKSPPIVATSTVTPTVVASTATLAVTSEPSLASPSAAPNLGATAVNIGSLNNWLVENGYEALKENPLLSELAQRQRSYLMSLSVPDFNALDSWYRDRDGRNASEMATAIGYNGDVQMIVEVASSVVMLDDILDKIETSSDTDVYSRFHEIGVDFQSSLTADSTKVFFVLILGTGAPS